MKSVPAGTVTFLFTDIEESTRLLQKLGDRYGELVAQHHRALRESAAASEGTEIDVQGDAFFFSFPRARDGVAGALTAGAAHGGQVLISEATRALLPSELSDRAEIVDLGEHTLKDMERSERLFQVVAPGLRSDFPPPRAFAAAQQQEDELERLINAFVNRGLSSVFERFVVGRTESGKLLIRRRGSRDA
jgi:class 3 adenylate cyclase